MKYTIEIDVKPGRCYMLLSKFLKALKLGGYKYSIYYKESSVDFEKIICDEVSKELGIDIMPIDLLKDVNKSEIVCARQICMVYRNKTMSLRQSAMPYNRDHATALHSKK
jgi:chromosomal replication initiation ATPase DnaA